MHINPQIPNSKFSQDTILESLFTFLVQMGMVIAIFGRGISKLCLDFFFFFLFLFLYSSLSPQDVSKKKYHREN